MLFGVLPLYVALLAALFLPEEPLRPRLILGVAIALGGLVLAFGESLDLGTGEHTALAALAVVLSPLASAIGNIATKKRMQGLDPLVMNGWAMVTGGVLLLAFSAPTEDWGATTWSFTTIGSIVYLAAFGTGFTFVTLTVLLRELPAVTVSFISMIIPFGALALGAVFRDETGDRGRRGRRAAGRGRDRGRAVPLWQDALMPSIVVLGARNLGGAILSHHLQAGWKGAAVARSAETLETVRAAGGLPLEADASDPESLRGGAGARPRRVRLDRRDRQRGVRRAADEARAVRRRVALRSHRRGLPRLDGRGRRAGVRVPERGRARRARRR